MAILVLTLRRTLNFDASFRSVGGEIESSFFSLDPIFEADFA